MKGLFLDRIMIHGTSYSMDREVTDSRLHGVLCVQGGMLQLVGQMVATSITVTECDPLVFVLVLFSRGPIVLRDVNGHSVFVAKVLVQCTERSVALEQLST